ncbi:hypothetical protein GLAREA_04501 [Glarea lozoyensis ATCC 20868]|uniref:Uncharacterized protein n=1 Tax=Glarea lozoyensis (strain ATCC 20868 / MF5171) TaxID=1116229 RepID=S3CPU2_GLAL2|nr:uncharacterized protein GLAREA_04501 [Glarea lozoyensis ATCC 20868]EPE27710.1 hypothetical protein GLAREA_04501 [Glarea lozoyensis ATCC 20868]
MSKFRASGKWNGDAPSRETGSIRGKTISNPIPIEDEDFPIRTPGTGIAVPIGSKGEEQIRLRSSNSPDLESIMERPALPVGAPADHLESTSVAAKPLEEKPARRTSPPRAPRMSTTSVPSKINMEAPQRKKSSLRTVFGKLFGKKRKSVASTTTAPSQDGGDRADQHRSDPSALTRNKRDSSNTQTRSVSLPINEYNRALRSHSIVLDPEDFTMRENPETNQRDSTQTDGQTRARRATTPSRLWTPTKAAGFAGDWTGLSPRPASSHARGSKSVSAGEADTGIGMAVTSGSHPNRRSRSVGELRAITSPAIARRRSDEIRYWRESYDPGVISPLSSNRAEDPILSDDGEDPHVEPEEPPQPFNFGPMGEMAGMKITQAASLESRVLQLENRVQRMEKAVIKLHRYQSAEALQLQDPPRRSNKYNSVSYGHRPATGTSEASLPKHETRHRTLDTGSYGSQFRSSSYGSSRPRTVDTDTQQLPSLETFPLSNNENSTSQTVRPLSTSTTIRGIPSSSPTISKDGSFTAEHLTYLTNLIVNEQTARHQLEAIVQTLSSQLQSLKVTSSGNDRLNLNTQGKARFEHFEQDDSEDEAGYGDEVFQTPNEERNWGDGTFGDVMKGDSRTLSLSRMTTGNGLQLV